MSLKTTLRGYQREAVRRAIKHNGFAFFPEQRTGKCLCSIAVADHVKPDIILIICPKKALRVWSDEFDKHLDLDWDCYIRYVHYEASAKEPLDRRRYYKLAKKWQKQGRSLMVICDEAHRLKKRGTHNSRFVRTIGKRATFRLALTGTPIAQGHKDAWAVFDFIQPGVYGKWEDFQSNFLRLKTYKNHQKGIEYTKIIGTQNEEEFLRIFHKYCYRITLAEARRSEGRKAARIKFSKVRFDLKPSSRHAYEELEEDLETIVNGETISTPLVLTLGMKLQQIAGGYLIQDLRIPGRRKKKRRIHTLGEEKLAKFAWLLKQPKLQDRHLVVCCRFKHEIARLGEFLEKKRVTWKIIAGKHPYNGEFDVDVIILQVQGAEAIDLSLANTYILYSWNHSLINFEQARFRVQSFDTDQVNYYFLIAIDTVDEDMFEVVVKKKDLATLICDRYRHEKH
jgi:superfamily II DNA or RNA helicase